MEPDLKIRKKIKRLGKVDQSKDWSIILFFWEMPDVGEKI